MKEGDGRMKIERMTEIETNDIQIGDRIHIGKYTATCQEIMPKGALFLLDQYIYGNGDLQNVIQSEWVLNIFKDIHEHMVSFDNGDLLKAPFGYGWFSCDRIRFRPVFLISMKNEDTIKKSAPEDEETVRDVLDTFNETQRLVLYYIVGKAVEGEETILDVLVTLNDKQRLALDYLVSKAVEDAKKGKRKIRFAINTEPGEETK